MQRLISGLTLAVLMVLCIAGAAQAQVYDVPIIVGGNPYTLTIVIDDDTISVTGQSNAIAIGEVVPRLTVEDESAIRDLDELKAEAVALEYDDLFRNNEDHVGTTVRYVGEVLEFKDQTCLLCREKEYMLRVAVTPSSFGLWDDPIWVDYIGEDRFLEDDLVTIWGTVDGLKTYQSVLGGAITIPRIQALDIVLGEVEGSVMTGPVANRVANLRGGPGTSYNVAGRTQEGEALDVVARNNDASWVQLAGGEWIAAFLVDNLGDPTALPLAKNIPDAPKAAAEEPAAEAKAVETSPASSPSQFTIGEEIQGNGWRFNVKEVHKRKAVYFYDDPHVAMNNWVILILDAVNEQGGTDHFANNIKPSLVDDAGNTYRQDSKASGYAQWQYGGISSIYNDVDPGSLIRIAMAFDIPDGVGDVMLSTDLPAWVSLGNVGGMEIED